MCTTSQPNKFLSKVLGNKTHKIIEINIPTDVGNSPHCKTTFFVTFPVESTYTPSSEIMSTMLWTYSINAYCQMVRITYGSLCTVLLSKVAYALFLKLIEIF